MLLVAAPAKTAENEFIGLAAAYSLLVALPFLLPIVSGPSVDGWQALVSWASAALCCGLGATRGTEPVRADRAESPLQAGIARGLLLASLVSVVLGLLQYYRLASPLIPWTTQPELGVAYGNLRQRNQFATLLALGLVAALWLHGGAGAMRRRWLLASMALLALGMAASTSRTGLLQWCGILSFAAFMAWRERRPAPERAAAPSGAESALASLADRGGAARLRLPPPWLLLALLALYFAATWVLPLLAVGDVEGLMRRVREGAPAGHSRLLLWNNVLTLIAQRPWTGWGWGELAFAHYSTLYPGPRFVEILDNAHNLPLHLAVELGIPVALLVCGGFAWLVVAARPWRERDPARLMAWGMLGAILLHSLVEYPLWYGPFQLVFGLCLGLLWFGRSASGAYKQKVTPGPVLRAQAAIFLIACISYVAWDYTRVSQLYLPRAERLAPYRDDTLAKVRDTRLFARYVRFAELGLLPLTPQTAPAVHALALKAIHFSPEPRVIVKLIDSSLLLGLTDEAAAHQLRFERAFPADYARWRAGQPVYRSPTPQ